MQQTDNKYPDVFELPVHLLVKSQKEAKKLTRNKAGERLSTFTQGVWFRLTTWYKR